MILTELKERECLQKENTPNISFFSTFAIKQTIYGNRNRNNNNEKLMPFFVVVSQRQRQSKKSH